MSVTNFRISQISAKLVAFVTVAVLSACGGDKQGTGANEPIDDGKVVASSIEEAIEKDFENEAAGSSEEQLSVDIASKAAMSLAFGGDSGQFDLTASLKMELSFSDNDPLCTFEHSTVCSDENDQEQPECNEESRKAHIISTWQCTVNGPHRTVVAGGGCDLLIDDLQESVRTITGECNLSRNANAAFECLDARAYDLKVFSKFNAVRMTEDDQTTRSGSIVHTVTLTSSGDSCLFDWIRELKRTATVTFKEDGSVEVTFDGSRSFGLTFDPWFEE